MLPANKIPSFQQLWKRSSIHLLGTVSTIPRFFHWVLQPVGGRRFRIRQVEDLQNKIKFHLTEQDRVGGDLTDHSPCSNTFAVRSMSSSDGTEVTDQRGAVTACKRNLKRHPLERAPGVRKRRRVSDSRESDSDPKKEIVNERERQNTRRMSDAFHRLRSAIPTLSSDKPSKLGTLRLATRYIAYLNELLSSPEV